MLKKAILRTVIVMIAAVIAVAVAGIVKFNILQDDIYIAGDSATEADLAGVWLRPIDGMPGVEDGFALKPGGEAESVNMATLPCSRWALKAPGRLQLDCLSVGNKVSSRFLLEYTITSVNKKRLFLKDTAGRELTYHRGRE